MKEKKKSDVAVLSEYAGNRKGLTFLGLVSSAVSILLSMASYIYVWLVAHDLIAAAPNWTQAQGISRYGWITFGFAIGGIILYFMSSMCTHLAALHTAVNVRRQGVAHMMRVPLGYFDSNASGLIHGRLNAATADTEQLMAHNLADTVDTIVLFVSMVVMMFIPDWRMGLVCLMTVVTSVIAMFSVTGGKNAQIVGEH